MDNTVSENTEKKTIEVKQSFFSSAISDISAYIQLVDTNTITRHSMQYAAPKIT